MMFWPCKMRLQSTLIFFHMCQGKVASREGLGLPEVLVSCMGMFPAHGHCPIPFPGAVQPVLR